MIAYGYDSITGEYSGEVERQLDPLETMKQGKNVYLTPASATITAPPIYGENKVAVFVKGTWTLKDDFRGVYYDTATKERKVIATIGMKPEKTWTKIVPPAFDETCSWVDGDWIIDQAKIAETQALAEREYLIQLKTRELAILSLQADGVLNERLEVVK